MKLTDEQLARFSEITCLVAGQKVVDYAAIARTQAEEDKEDAELAPLLERLAQEALAHPEKMGDLGELIAGDAELLKDVPFEVNDLTFIQAVDYVFRGERTDDPPCTSPILAEFARRLNEAPWGSDQMRTDVLRSCIPLLIDTRTEGQECGRKRLHLFIDFALREAVPLAFESACSITQEETYRTWAAKLRALSPLVDAQTVKDAQPVAQAALRAVISETRYNAQLPASGYASNTATVAAYGMLNEGEPAFEVARSAGVVVEFAAGAGKVAGYPNQLLERAAEVLAAACALR